ncbi:hypothetical protein [Bacteroides thetaiotaomicron]|uniref:hypothetical protein n=2 Tax=Bacteroides TaxID=816 RepID=UPI0035697D76
MECGLPCHQQRQYGDKCLEAFDGSYERTAYINEAKTLRCMVYYNLSQLWGSVPYITVPATSNNYDEILHSPVRSPQDLCWGLLNELQDITRLPGGCVKSKNQVFFDILY